MEFEKFRDPIIDPLKIVFRRSVQINEVLNYPHAGNDVLHCQGFIEGEEKEFILKISRHADADFQNEKTILNRLKNGTLKVPRVIEFGKSGNQEYLILEKLPGKRISSVLEEYRKDQGRFCRRIGESLARIHHLEIDAAPVKSRRFHKIADSEGDPYLSEINNWLSRHKPKAPQSCFVHGDHHYANLLWEHGEISAVLDWELSGIGNKEFDLAWAIFVRSSALYHQFLHTTEEENEILEGYRSLASFHYPTFQYYKVQILGHLHKAPKLSQGYRSFIEQEFGEITGVRCYHKP